MTMYDSARFMPPAPVASATVRSARLHPAKVVVEFLIDTGADMTVVPRAVAVSLGIAPSSINYEITGWDGAQRTVPSVEATITLLGKNFRGVYLLADDDMGILGRDILNGLCLQFDGPNIDWSRVIPRRA